MAQSGKDLFQSKVTIGVLVSIAGILLGHFGIPVEVEAVTDEVTKLVSLGVEAFGLLTVLYGRFKAEKPITSVAGVGVNK